MALIIDFFLPEIVQSHLFCRSFLFAYDFHLGLSAKLLRMSKGLY